jgi:ferritin-like metal-binding protein YciE
MGWFSDDIETMEHLFVHSLQDIYYAEHRIEKALPSMIAKASDTELKRAFQAHLRQTRAQIKRLDRVFKRIKRTPQANKCPAIDGIIDEANEIAGDVADTVVLNAALIAAAQAVEHYEIRRYGTLTAWAKLLGHSDVAKLLFASLKEEKAADRKLSGIAKRKINKKALARRPKPLTIEEKLEEAMVGIPAIG